MQEYHTNIHTSLKFVSPIYKLMMSSVARYIWQVPDLYADIQMNNDEILNVHDIFISSAQTFHEIVKKKNRLAFIEEIDKTRAFFWKDHCENWQKFTDKIIYLLSKQSKQYQKNIWKEIYLENIYSNTKISGVLNSYSESIIEVNNSIFNLNEWIIVTD